MTTCASALDKILIYAIFGGEKVEVQEVARDYVIIDGEKIYFDEPFDKEPDKDDFEKWLRRVGDLLETLFCSRATNEAIYAS